MSSCLCIKDTNLTVLLLVFAYLLLQINILFSRAHRGTQMK
jgi:hypothetical protein